ncbi:hypothetical protein [Halococcus sp. PRR34]|uniref:hypothetical protein n=1 Tax=Halococcus sp. PRR34 TaxID=3020830 RepID=UPI002360606B|nr:hypothetical protein [Halococcus sp. PRR34]
MTAHAAKQAVRGTVLGVRGTARCTKASCSRELAEGDEIATLVYRHSDESVWTVGSVFCRACRVEQVRHPTLGAEEYVVAARVGSTMDVVEQIARLTIIVPEVLDTAGPSQGHMRSDMNVIRGP